MTTTCSLHDVIHRILPAITQGAEYISRHNAAIMLPSKCDPSILRLIDNMGLSIEPVKPYLGGNYRPKLLLETCAAPVTSPTLWEKMRTILDIPTSQSEEGFVIFIVKGTLNGRTVSVLNKAAAVSRLSAIYGNRLLILGEDLSDVLVARTTFEKAAIVIGIPCDQMDLIVFSPPGITVIEFLPLSSTTTRSSWVLASSLGHRYALTYEGMSTREGSCTVSPVRLVTLLRRLGHLDAKDKPQYLPKALSLKQIDDMLVW